MERHVVDGGYVTNYNDPVVGIKPINQKSIETAMSGKICNLGSKMATFSPEMMVFQLEMGFFGLK